MAVRMLFAGNLDSFVDLLVSLKLEDETVEFASTHNRIYIPLDQVTTFSASASARAEDQTANPPSRRRTFPFPRDPVHMVS